jgi:hypothetical protein
MARRRSLLWMGVGAGVVLAARVAAASTSSDWFAWEAPRECPGREAMVERIREATREAPGDDVHAQVRVVEEGDGRWSASVSVTAGGNRSDRLLGAASCSAIADAAALIVGLSLTLAPAVSVAASSPAVSVTAPSPSGASGIPAPSPSAASEATAPAVSLLPQGPAPVATDAPQSMPDSSRERASATSAARSRPLAGTQPIAPEGSASSTLSRTRGSLTLRAAGAVDVGTLPSAGPGVTMGASWRAAPLEIGLDAAAFAAQRGAVSGTTSGASVGLGSAALDACLVVPWGDRVVMTPCAGFALERLAADGFGPSGAFVAAQRAIVLPAAFGDLGLEWWPSRHVGFRGAVRGVAPFDRPTFVVQGPGGGAAHRPSIAAVEPSLGVVVRLGK